MDLPKVVFVTGIGTDVGKSWATGWLARELAADGRKVITQKFVQTGNKDFSEDIDVHRRVMGIPMQARDLDHTTAPIILSYPCSPDLAERIDGITIDWQRATDATATLAAEYDHVLIEGAGGALVPMHLDYLEADYMRDHGLPAVVVTNGQLGSINHTLLTLEALAARGVEIAAVVYNPHFDRDAVICDDTRAYIRRYLAARHPSALYLEMPATLPV